MQKTKTEEIAWLLRKALAYRHHRLQQEQAKAPVYYKNRGRRLAITSSETTKVNPEKTKFKTDCNTKGQWSPSSGEGLIFISFDYQPPRGFPSQLSEGILID